MNKMNCMYVFDFVTNVAYFIVESKGKSLSEPYKMLAIL